MNSEASLYDNILEALKQYAGSWILVQYLTKDEHPCVHVGRLSKVSKYNLTLEDGSPSLWKRLFHKDKIIADLGENIDLWFEDGLRRGLISFGGLTQSRVARVIRAGGQVLYENKENMTDWDIRSGMVSVLYPAEEILRNFGIG